MKKKSLFDKLRDFAFGFFVMDPLMTIRKVIYNLNLAFMDITIGDLLGIPLIPPIYKLKLLPYWYPNIEKWKIRRMKEYDVTDLIRE